MKIALLFLFSISSLANFSGKWSARGYFESDRKEGECKEIFMQFKKTSKKFMILDGGYICGDIQASYPPSSFEIVNNSLIYFGEKVGVISKDLIEINYLDGVYKLSLKAKDGQVFFNETWQEDSDYLFINSKLKKID
jgi:hypothetical protein